jgi:hypothetical protein
LGRQTRFAVRGNAATDTGTAWISAAADTGMSPWSTAWTSLDAFRKNFGRPLPIVGSSFVVVPPAEGGKLWAALKKGDVLVAAKFAGLDAGGVCLFDSPATFDHPVVEGDQRVPNPTGCRGARGRCGRML